MYWLHPQVGRQDMTESTGLPASTIHRLLGLNGRESNDTAGTKDIEGALLIIDEMSMVDTYLFESWFGQFPIICRLSW